MGKGQSRDAKKVSIVGKGIKNLEKDVPTPNLLKTVMALESIELSKNKIQVSVCGPCLHLLLSRQTQYCLKGPVTTYAVRFPSSTFFF